MKAAVITEHGELDKVVVLEIEDPKPAAGEVAVDVRSAALNHLDIWVRMGRPGMALEMPHVLGSDASGVVSAVGEGVSGVEVGQEVIIFPGLACGRCEYCLRGEQSECEHFGIVGMARPGVFAELACVPAENVIPKPPSLSFDAAATLGIAYLTAWRMLMMRAALRPGECVLIHGIGGGAATAALQFARVAGAEVIVTSSSDKKLERARGLGAGHTINYAKSEDLVAEIMEACGGRGVDVVIDSVGAATWPVDLKVARKGGRIVLCGVTTGAAAETDLQAVYWRQLSILGSTMGSRENLRLMLRTVVANAVEPVIDSVFPLDKFVEAMKKMELHEQFGKIILNVSE